MTVKTGWPPGLLQDDDRKLSRWFASRPDARYQVRKNMTEQPDALRLAEWLEADACDLQTPRDAAAELRRLHSVNAQLLEALEYFHDYGYDREMGYAAIAAAKGEA